MSNLIKNELYKIFRKKGIYIALLITFAFVLLFNVVLKNSGNNNGYYSYYSPDYKANTEKVLKTLDPNKASDISMYVDYKTSLEVYDLYQKYKTDSWQAQKVIEEVQNLIREKNIYLYGLEKDEKIAEQMQEKIDKFIEKLDNNDWKYFANEELETAKKELEEVNIRKANTVDKQEIENIEEEIKEKEISLEVAKLRIEKNIPYANDYKNDALKIYEETGKTLIYMEKEDLKFEEESMYQQNKEDFEISKYVIENNININKNGDLRAILMDFFNQYGLFILVIVIMISGTIVSEEFSKGTIKLLLVRPYSRSKILMAKFIAILVVILIAILSVIAMQLAVGGVLFGFDSLSIPVLHYDFVNDTLIQINVFADLVISILCKLPIIILLATLSFAFSAIFTNSAVAVALPLLGYMGADIINSLAIAYKVEALKYFVTLNWDFKYYLFGKLPMMEGLTFGFSAVICVIYMLIMLVTTFMIFKKKNIKNI